MASNNSNTRGMPERDSNLKSILNLDDGSDLMADTGGLSGDTNEEEPADVMWDGRITEEDLQLSHNLDDYQDARRSNWRDSVKAEKFGQDEDNDDDDDDSDRSSLGRYRIEADYKKPQRDGENSDTNSIDSEESAQLREDAIRRGVVESIIVERIYHYMTIAFDWFMKLLGKLCSKTMKKIQKGDDEEDALANELNVDGVDVKNSATSQGAGATNTANMTSQMATAAAQSAATSTASKSPSLAFCSSTARDFVC
jgi:hypothetical protein